MHQRCYIKEVLKQHVRVKGALGWGELSELVKQAQCLTGQLLWLAGRTRPDIAFAVSMMGQLIVSDPAETIARGHQLIRFIRHTPDVGCSPAPSSYGLWGQLQWKQGNGSIHVFTDASFMMDSESRSIGSAQLFWGGAVVMWNCGKQPLLSASTAEAEIIAMAEGFTIGRSLQPFITALCEHKSVNLHAAIYTDNAAALQLCTLDAGSWRTRHLRLRGNMIRQAVE